MSMQIEPTDIDITPITNNGKWRVTLHGKDIDMIRPGKSAKTKTVALVLEQLLNRDGKQCHTCGRTEWLTVDHIVPINILRDFGVPEIETYADSENLRILCKPCNQFKSGRLDFADPRTKRVLTRLIEKL